MENFKFDVEIKEVEKVNPLFSKCKIYICYADENRNGSDIPKEVIENAIPTLYNCPILGEYNETLEDFRDHGGKIEIKDNEVKYIQTTQAYGLIPESSEVTWEMVEDKEYLTCTGFLWTSRYPEAETVIENGKGQSMEIENVAGKYVNKKFKIESFTFSGLTILGDDVEPCFEDAKIVAYTLDKDNFKLEFAQMIQELKEYQSSTEGDINKISEEGGNSVNEKLELLTKYNFTQEQMTEQGVNLEEISLEDLQNKLFALTHSQLMSEIRRELSEVTYMDEDWWGDPIESQRYYFRDCDDNFVYVVDCADGYKDMKMPYSKQGDNVTIDFENASRIKYSPVDWEGGDEEEVEPVLGEFKKFMLTKSQEKVQFEKDAMQSMMDEMGKAHEEKMSQMQSTMDSMKEDMDKLMGFKADRLQADKQAEVDSIFTQFSTKLTNEEIAPYKEKALEMDLDILKKELFALVGMKSTQFNLSNQNKFNNMGIDLPKPDDTKTENETVWDKYKNNLNN